MKVIIVLLVALLGGCATTVKFDSTPVSKEEFSKPLDIIRTDFDDIELYESSYWDKKRVVGDFEDLKIKWGEPDKVEKRWGEELLGALLGAAVVALPGGISWDVFIIIQGLFIFPAEDNYWKKQNYEIKATSHRLFWHGYSKRIFHWEWNENTEQEKTIDNDQ